MKKTIKKPARKATKTAKPAPRGPSKPRRSVEKFLQARVVRNVPILQALLSAGFAAHYGTGANLLKKHADRVQELRGMLSAAQQAEAEAYWRSRGAEGAAPVVVPVRGSSIKPIPPAAVRPTELPEERPQDQTQKLRSS